MTNCSVALQTAASFLALFCVPLHQFDISVNTTARRSYASIAATCVPAGCTSSVSDFVDFVAPFRRTIHLSNLSVQLSSFMCSARFRDVRIVQIVNSLNDAFSVARFVAVA